MRTVTNETGKIVINEILNLFDLIKITQLEKRTKLIKQQLDIIKICQKI